MCVGQVSVVGIVTHCGLDSSGIKYRWGRDFWHPSRPALGPTQTYIQWALGLFRHKGAGVWCSPPAPI
jgi:hypothetical protein